MSIFSAIGKGITSAIEDFKKPQSFKDGDEFEKYVQEVMFPKRIYDLLEKTHSYTENKNQYVKSSLNPDFKFMDKSTKKMFYVEAKFRTTLLNGKIQWCNDEQYKRYNLANKTVPVLLALDFYDSKADNSENDFLAVLPLSEVKYTGLYPNFGKLYQVGYDAPITSRYLSSLIK